MKITKVNINNESLSNCYLLTDEKTGYSAMVDPGGFLDEVIETAEREKSNIKYILLTHGHFDHLLGAPLVKEVTGSPIAIGKGDEKCLESKEANLMKKFGVEAFFVPVNPDIILKDGDEITIGESIIKVMATPGHSKGGVVFIDEESRSIISGDTLFYSTVGRTDNVGASDEELAESLRKLIAFEGDYTVYPGHGPETTLSHERVRNIYIRRMNR